MGTAWASSCGGGSAVDRGRGSQVESMASHRKMLIEELFLFSMDFTVSQNFFEFVLQEANFCLTKLALAF